MQITLFLAAVYNIFTGLTILFLLGALGPLIESYSYVPPLFRMLAGGTAVLFGIAYLAVLNDYSRNKPLMILGMALQYWVFAISLAAFRTSDVSVEVFAFLGGGNFLFALLFTYQLWRERCGATAARPGSGLVSRSAETEIFGDHRVGINAD
jgi:hypothetical protein